MTKNEKAQQIDELAEKLADNSYYYITDSSDLTVAQTNELRKMCFDSGVFYKVYKNTFIKKALERKDDDVDYTPIYEHALKGFSGIMFHPEKAKAPAEVLKKFRKAHSKIDRPILKGAVIDTAIYIGHDKLEELSSLKSKEEVVADIIGLLQSPAKNVISALQSGGGKIAGILKTLSEKEG
ncbi:MAG: 50S ribosomal protein L10 [Cyclobacteriaceae bacterium]|nr:50S ribosomal protein L10 [Cyclobacteriaceae bacterium]MCH8516176.1 50S ribosomal protein L10 [Cyclobacteriaceae bacterium]